MFDILGILSPVIINAKIMIQDLWRSELDWKFQDEYVKFHNELILLSTYRIPSWIQWKPIVLLPTYTQRALMAKSMLISYVPKLE